MPTVYETISAISRLWEGHPVQANTGYCLNARHALSRCRICIDACPANAILAAEPIYLNEEACVRCGVCLHVCPTGVFAQAHMQETKLLRSVARSEAEVLEIACPNKPEPEKSRVRGATVIVSPRCLGALSLPLLLQFVALGKTVWLNDDHCDDCPIVRARNTIERNARRANAIIANLPRRGVVLTYQSHAKRLLEEAQTCPVVRSGSVSVVSRRDFFGSLGDTAREMSASAIASFVLPVLEPLTPEETREKMPHHIPPERQHMAIALGQFRQPPPEKTIAVGDLPLGDVRVSDACTACGLCAYFCPTEALFMASDGGYFVLHFSAALCLGRECGLCVLACPVKAVSWGMEVRVAELLGVQPRPVRAGEFTPCEKCGEQTARRPEGEPSLCHVHVMMDRGRDARRIVPPGLSEPSDPGEGDP